MSTMFIHSVCKVDRSVNVFLLRDDADAEEFVISGFKVTIEAVETL